MPTSVIGICLANDLIFKDFNCVKLKIGRDVTKQYELKSFRVFAHTTNSSFFLKRK